MNTNHIRHAVEADLALVAAVWQDASLGGRQPASPPLAEIPSLYVHELATNELFVLERDGRVVAFAAVINRGGVAFLADLFVATAHQSMGLGQALLREVLPEDDRVRCTVSSTDPRALPLYVRSGMRPHVPYLNLRAELGLLRGLDASGIEVVEAAADDGEWLRWDAEIGGRARPEDHAYWIAQRGGVPLWFVRGGRTVGYGMAQTRTDGLFGLPPDVMTLGPIGARERGDAADCALAAVSWARRRATQARMAVVGPHPALTALLESGFRIVEVETFCLSSSEAFVDVQRYVPSGGDLF